MRRTNEHSCARCCITATCRGTYVPDMNPQPDPEPMLSVAHRLPIPDFGAGLNFVGVDGVPREVPANEIGRDWFIDSRWLRHPPPRLVPADDLAAARSTAAELHSRRELLQLRSFVFRAAGRRRRCDRRICSNPCASQGSSGSDCRCWRSEARSTTLPRRRASWRVKQDWYAHTPRQRPAATQRMP